MQQWPFYSWQFLTGWSGRICHSGKKYAKGIWLLLCLLLSSSTASSSVHLGFDKSPSDNIPYEALLRSAGIQWGWNWRLLAAVAKQESSYNPQAVSRVGARGLLQIMPQTASEIAADLGLKTWDLNDPGHSIHMGAYYLTKMRAHVKPFARDYRHNIVLALCAYNAGPHRVSQYKDCPPFRETQRYHRKIFAYWEQYKKEYLP